MKETFRSNNFHPDSPQIKILQSYILLQENKTTEVDQLCKQAMQIFGIISLIFYTSNSPTSLYFYLFLSFLLTF